MNKIILSAVITTMLSTPIAWADSHRNMKEQPVKIIITQPVQHVVKNPVTKNNVVKRNATKSHVTKNYVAKNNMVKRNATKSHVTKNYVAKNNMVKRNAAKSHVTKNYVVKNNVTHRSIRTKPVNNQHHSQNRSHTGKLISNVVGLLWVIK